jgi:hypothetical protein
MIDWFYLLYNFMWLLGVALLLMIVSLIHWQSEQQQRSFRQSLAEPNSRLAIAGAFVLVGLGLTLSVDIWQYRVSWGVLTLLALWIGGVAWQEKAK